MSGSGHTALGAVPEKDDSRRRAGDSMEFQAQDMDDIIGGIGDASILAAAKLTVLQGLAFAQEVEDDGRRERMLVMSLHEALRLCVHGVIQRQSLQCLRLAIFLSTTCLGTMGPAESRERLGILGPLLSAYTGPNDVMRDPRFLDLESVESEDVKDLRWPLDFLEWRKDKKGPANALRDYALQTVFKNYASWVEAVKAIEDARHCPDLRSTPKVQAVVAKFDNILRMRADARLVCNEGGIMPADKLAALQRLLVSRQRPAALEEEGEAERERPRERTLAELKAAKTRAEKLETWLLARMGADGRKDCAAQYRALLELTAVPLDTCMGELLRMNEAGGPLTETEIGEAMHATQRFIRGDNVWYRLPEFEPLGRRASSSGGSGGSGRGVEHGYEREVMLAQGQRHGGGGGGGGPTAQEEEEGEEERRDAAELAAWGVTMGQVVASARSVRAAAFGTGISNSGNGGGGSDGAAAASVAGSPPTPLVAAAPCSAEGRGVVVAEDECGPGTPPAIGTGAAMAAASPVPGPTSAAAQGHVGSPGRAATAPLAAAAEGEGAAAASVQQQEGEDAAPQAAGAGAAGVSSAGSGAGGNLPQGSLPAAAERFDCLLKAAAAAAGGELQTAASVGAAGKHGTSQARAAAAAADEASACVQEPSGGAGSLFSSSGAGRGGGGGGGREAVGGSGGSIEEGDSRCGGLLGGDGKLLYDPEGGAPTLDEFRLRLTSSFLQNAALLEEVPQMVNGHSDAFIQAACLLGPQLEPSAFSLDNDAAPWECGTLQDAFQQASSAGSAGTADTAGSQPSIPCAGEAASAQAGVLRSGGTSNAGTAAEGVSGGVKNDTLLFAAERTLAAAHALSPFSMVPGEATGAAAVAAAASGSAAAAAAMPAQVQEVAAAAQVWEATRPLTALPWRDPADLAVRHLSLHTFHQCTAQPYLDALVSGEGQACASQAAVEAYVCGRSAEHQHLVLAGLRAVLEGWNLLCLTLFRAQADEEGVGGETDDAEKSYWDEMRTVWASWEAQRGMDTQQMLTQMAEGGVCRERCLGRLARLLGAPEDGFAPVEDVGRLMHLALVDDKGDDSEHDKWHTHACRVICHALELLARQGQLAPRFAHAVLAFLHGSLDLPPPEHGSRVSADSVASLLHRLLLPRVFQLAAFVAPRVQQVYPHPGLARPDLQCLFVSQPVCLERTAEGEAVLKLGPGALCPFEEAAAATAHKVEPPAGRVGCLVPSEPSFEPSLKGHAVKLLAHVACGASLVRLQPLGVDMSERLLPAGSKEARHKSFQDLVSAFRKLAFAAGPLRRLVRLAHTLQDSTRHIARDARVCARQLAAMDGPPGQGLPTSQAPAQMARSLLDMVTCVDAHRHNHRSVCLLSSLLECTLRYSRCQHELALLRTQAEEVAAKRRASAKKAGKAAAEQVARVDARLHALQRQLVVLARQMGLVDQALSDSSRDDLAPGLYANLARCQHRLAEGAEKLQQCRTWDETRGTLRPLSQLLEQVAAELPTLRFDPHALVNLHSVAEAASATAFGLQGRLILEHCTGPTSEPVYEFLVRHILADRWEAQAAADEEEARRRSEAASRELLEGLEEEGQEGEGSAAAKARQEKQRAKKKKAKKAARKRGPKAAEGEGEAEQGQPLLAAANAKGAQEQQQQQEQQEQQQDAISAADRGGGGSLRGVQETELVQTEAEFHDALPGEGEVEEEEQFYSAQPSPLQSGVAGLAAAYEELQQEEQEERPWGQGQQAGGERGGSGSGTGGAGGIRRRSLQDDLQQHAAAAADEAGTSAAAAATAGEAEQPPAEAVKEQQQQQQPSPRVTLADQQQHQQQPPAATAKEQHQQQPPAAIATEQQQQQQQQQPPAAIAKDHHQQQQEPPQEEHPQQQQRPGAPSPLPVMPGLAAKQPAQQQAETPSTQPAAQQPEPEQGQQAEEEVVQKEEVVEDSWHEAPSKRSSRLAKRAPAAPATQAPAPLAKGPRIVRWSGHWVCGCGNPNLPRNHCRQCGTKQPCREYVFEGGCRRGGDPSAGGWCRHPHPPFDLPPGPRPFADKDGFMADHNRIINPPPGTPLHRPSSGGPGAAGTAGAAGVQHRPSSGGPGAAGTAGAAGAQPRPSSGGSSIAGTAGAAGTQHRPSSGGSSIAGTAGAAGVQHRPSSGGPGAAGTAGAAGAQHRPSSGGSSIAGTAGAAGTQHRPSSGGSSMVGTAGAAGAQHRPSSGGMGAAGTAGAAGAQHRPSSGGLGAAGTAGAAGVQHRPCSGGMGAAGTAGGAATQHRPSSGGSSIAGTAGAAAAQRSPSVGAAPRSPVAPRLLAATPPVVPAAAPAGRRSPAMTAPAAAAAAAVEATAAAAAAAALASPGKQPPVQCPAGAWQPGKSATGDHLAPAAATSAAPAGAAPDGNGWGARSWKEAEQAPGGGSQAGADEDAELADIMQMLGVTPAEPQAAGGEATASSPATVAPAASGSSAWGGGTAAQQAVAVKHAQQSGASSPALAAVAAWPGPGESQEDAELAAAIQASLADAQASTEASIGQLRSRAAWPANGVAATGDGLALPGLRNETGEYNCFLNVIIQCLWRCADFRRQVSAWDAAFCSTDTVVGSLHTLFQQFQQQEQQLQGAGGTPASGTLPPVDPTALREALARLPGQQFGLGEMNDAAEVLLSIYERVMEAAGAAGRPSGIDATFGLSVREEVRCSNCGKTTHQSSYEQYFYNTQATGLRHLCLFSPGSSTGQLLRELEAQHHKSCDVDMAGCGKPSAVSQFLQQPPRVFTLQLTWESHSEQPEDIAATMAALNEEVDLGEVYQGIERGAHLYRLRSMVCYYGQHYQALVLVPDAGGWLMFDDTRVTRVGSWADVRRKCEAGRIQPSVLFYEAP